jgi:hypothetical protein
MDLKQYFIWQNLKKYNYYWVRYQEKKIYRLRTIFLNLQVEQKIAFMKPIIGITLGDYNGIGPEVILKSLASPRLLKWCTPVIYGSAKVLDFYRQKF